MEVILHFKKECNLTYLKNPHIWGYLFIIIFSATTLEGETVVLLHQKPISTCGFLLVMVSMPKPCMAMFGALSDLS